MINSEGRVLRKALLKGTKDNLRGPQSTRAPGSRGVEEAVGPSNQCKRSLEGQTQGDQCCP